MSQIQYVLRANFFGYNDETFYVAGSRMQAVYDTHAEAQAALRSLELQNARNFELHEIDSFFDGSQEFIQKMDRFVFERCGEHILEDGEVIQDTIPDALNDDDTLEFINLVGMNSFQIIEVQPDSQFYTLWLPHQQEYAMNYDESGTSLIYAESAQQLLEDALENLMYEFDEPMHLKGTLAELSDSPTLLQAAIDTQKNLSYNTKKTELTLKKRDEKALIAINDLLKQPFYEIRPLPLTELMQLEAACGAGDEYWEE
ncbi:MAG: hypothetical protein VXW65_05895 [Pseudomonadota bacterium]|nr:hypothetical protein [Pseudomonadota bacterium]